MQTSLACILFLYCSTVLYPRFQHVLRQTCLPPARTPGTSCWAPIPPSGRNRGHNAEGALRPAMPPAASATAGGPMERAPWLLRAALPFARCASRRHGASRCGHCHRSRFRKPSPAPGRAGVRERRRTQPLPGLRLARPDPALPPLPRRQALAKLRDTRILAIKRKAATMQRRTTDAPWRRLAVEREADPEWAVEEEEEPGGTGDELPMVAVLRQMFDSLTAMAPRPASAQLPTSPRSERPTKRSRAGSSAASSADGQAGRRGRLGRGRGGRGPASLQDSAGRGAHKEGDALLDEGGEQLERRSPRSIDEYSDDDDFGAVGRGDDDDDGPPLPPEDLQGREAQMRQFYMRIWVTPPAPGWLPLAPLPSIGAPGGTAEAHSPPRILLCNNTADAWPPHLAPRRASGNHPGHSAV